MKYLWWEVDICCVECLLCSCCTFSMQPLLCVCFWILKWTVWPFKQSRFQSVDCEMKVFYFLDDRPDEGEDNRHLSASFGQSSECRWSSLCLFSSRLRSHWCWMHNAYGAFMIKVIVCLEYMSSKRLVKVVQNNF